MRGESVCNIYYTKFTEKYERAELQQYQKKLVLDMLRHGFSDFFLCADFDERQIKRSEFGKPYYVRNPNWHFNISHCKNAVAVAVSKYPVGVDVESMRKVKPQIVRKCCSVKEQQYVMDVKDMAGVEQRFLQLWTLKESYVKMTGEGIRMPLDTIVFKPEAFYGERDILICPKEGSENSFSCLYFPEELILAVTVQHAVNTQIRYYDVRVKRYFAPD